MDLDFAVDGQVKRKSFVEFKMVCGRTKLGSPLVLNILSFRLNDLESPTVNNIYIITPESLMNNHPYLYTSSYCCFRLKNQNKSRKNLSWYICEKWETFGSWNYGNLKCGIYVKRKTIGKFM